MIYGGELKYTKELIDHRERVRKVYSTPEGRKELFNMLVDTGLLADITPDRIALRNYSVKKLEEMGMLDEVIVRHFIDHFFEMNPKTIEMNEMERQIKEKSDGWD